MMETMRVTPEQRDLILWLEESGNYDYIISVLNDRLKELSATQIQLIRALTQPTAMELFDQMNAAKINQASLQYFNEEIEKIMDAYNLFKKVKVVRKNVRGRRKRIT